MKQTVAPLQANEVNIVRRKLASFDVSAFQSLATHPDDAYEFLIKLHVFAYITCGIINCEYVSLFLGKTT